MKTEKNIIAIIGPKGGVGKSTILANLAIALAEIGNRVVAVDLDLGASNLHALFGIRDSKYSLNDFVENKVKNLSEIVIKTRIKDMNIICGGDNPGIANMAYQKKQKLIRHLSSLDCDILILDLAPGASYNVADFSIIASNSILITTADVPSVMNVYGFIKALVFRQLSFLFKRVKSSDLLDLLEDAKDFEKNPHLKTMDGFMNEAEKIDPIKTVLVKRLIYNFKPFVVVNRVKTKKDMNAGNVIKKILKQYLSISSTEIMSIREDNEVGRALIKLKPILSTAPSSIFCEDIRKIARKIAV